MTGHRSLALAALVAGAAACQGDPRRNVDIRQWTDDIAFRISIDSPPPHAAERIRYKVVARDKESGQPIDGGQGRLYANTRDGARTNDGLQQGPEPGTYYANLFYPVGGEWAVGLQFRRDSTKRLETMNWMQEVRPAREGH